MAAPLGFEPRRLKSLAEGEGIEPSTTESKSVVIPFN